MFGGFEMRFEEWRKRQRVDSIVAICVIILVIALGVDMYF